jgi:uncharacterized Rossmann fold enzyme
MTMQALEPLRIEVSQFGAAEQRAEHIRTNIARGLPEFTPALVEHDGTMVVVGSGPSLPTFIEQIKEERAKGRPICCVKGAHDFLCEHGLEPDLFVSVEPRDRRHNIRKHNDHTVYMLASRVAPEMFDYLAERKIIIWHSYGTEDEIEVLKSANTRYAVGGGSTSGLRAIALTYQMGFRHFILVGFDSCLGANGFKRFDSGKFEGITRPVRLEPDGREYIGNMAMLAQAREFQTATYGVLPNIHFDVWGDGLIAGIVEQRKKKGLST